MSLSPHITPAEWRWAAGWSVAVLVLSCLPYLIVAQAAPPGWQFAGILINPMDGNSYMAKMQQGVDGRWLFHLTYTPEPHNGAFIFTFYLFLGHLARLTGLSKILVFHLARLLAGLGLLLVAFRFIVHVTPNPTERRLAFVLLCLASGLGWLGVIFGAFPIDLWVPEAFTPYSLYANPHFPLAMMLMLIINYQLMINNDQLATYGKSQLPIVPKLHRAGNYQLLITTGLASLLLALILPFALLTVWAILVVFVGWKYARTRRLPWAQIWLTLVVILFATPVILYQYWVSTTNPILAGWGAQNITSAPSLLNFGLGYGLVGIFAIIGAFLIIRSYRLRADQNEMPGDSCMFQGEWLVLCWAVTTVVLVYLPFDLQRRLITGLHLPVCILAAIGLCRWPVIAGLKPTYQHLIRLGVIALSSLGTLFVWSLPIFGALQSPAESPTTALLFMRQEEIAAFEWLRSQAQPDDIILASPRLGLFVPGQTGARAFYGHPFETTEAKAKEAQVTAFFQGKIDSVSPPADFIIYGPSEQALGRPAQLSAYPAVFSAGNVIVYKVVE